MDDARPTSVVRWNASHAPQLELAGESFACDVTLPTERPKFNIALTLGESTHALPHPERGYVRAICCAANHLLRDGMMA